MLSREEFLRLLADEAGKCLPPIEVELLKEEMRAHLEESIQARLELGASLGEAERQALAEFGTAASIGEEARRRDAKIDRGFLGVSMAVAAFWVGAFFSAPLSDSMKDLMMLCFIGLHVFFVAFAAKTRRFQKEVLTGVLGGAWAFWAIKGALGYSMVPEEAYDNRALDFVREAIATIRLGGWIFAAIYLGLYVFGFNLGRLGRLISRRRRGRA
ncbi:hypothetical protein EON82_09430 [bacterium]|nr:MAG: hypothetical protein EON82_09430 [bacterium]